jgi:hypothetical protein
MDQANLLFPQIVFELAAVDPQSLRILMVHAAFDRTVAVRCTR